MSAGEGLRDQMAAELLVQAARRFGQGRAVELRPQIELAAAAMARVLVETLDPADERPIGWPTLEVDA